jgi:hypothetical protein
MARKTHRGEKAQLRKEIESAQQSAGVDVQSLDFGSINLQLREKFRYQDRAVFTEGCKTPDGELLKIASGLTLALVSEGLTIFGNVARAREAFTEAAQGGDDRAAAVAELRLEGAQAMMKEHAKLTRSLRPLISVMAKLVDTQAKLDADAAVGELTLKAFDGDSFSSTFDAESTVH